MRWWSLLLCALSLGQALAFAPTFAADVIGPKAALKISSTAVHTSAVLQQSPSRCSPLLASLQPLPPLHLYNSLSRSKQLFVPLSASSISMYTCGPTTYASCHLGNLRSLLSSDVLKRSFLLLFPKHAVKHVINLTDVDDKIIAKCRELGLDRKQVTEPVIESFFKDLNDLNVLPASSYPRASEHIDEIASLVETLQSKGLAYSDPSDGGSVYFNVSKQEGYGTHLANLQPSSVASSSSDTSSSSSSPSEDSSPRDFCLWKSFRPSFDIPSASWRPRSLPLGRPGWHTECSAMCRHALGPRIDVHAGGVDLRFPHHENEIAQWEGAGIDQDEGGDDDDKDDKDDARPPHQVETDGRNNNRQGETRRFANYWVHNAFVQVGPRGVDKMSKSLGNMVSLSSSCPSRLEKRAFRYLVVSSHYRSPLAFSEEALNAAVGALRRLDAAHDKLRAALKTTFTTTTTTTTNASSGPAPSPDVNVGGGGGGGSSALSSLALFETASFLSAIADDLSTPRAAACLFSVVKGVEASLSSQRRDSSSKAAPPPLDVAGLAAAAQALEIMDRVFGVLGHGAGGPSGDEEEGETAAETPKEVEKLVDDRADAKEKKDWKTADALRKQILALGYEVRDVKDDESDPPTPRQIIHRITP